MSEILKAYTDPANPGSFSGLTGFVKNNKQFKIKDVREALKSESAYTLHNNVKRKFPRAKFIAGFIDEIWQLDLVDVSNLKNKKLNQWYTFLLVCICVFSKYAWVEPLKNKEAKTTKEAFEKILKRAYPRKPHIVYMDNGKEFMGEFRAYCADNKIRQIFTNSIHKAAVAERFNRTFKQKMFRYFSFQKEKNYVKILQDLINSYNNSYHRTIKTKPVLVTKTNEKKNKKITF